MLAFVGAEILFIANTVLTTSYIPKKKKQISVSIKYTIDLSEIMYTQSQLLRF